MLKGHTEMSVLNAAIIGCGTIFEKHAEAVAGLEKARLYAVCDIDAEKAEKAAKQYGCRCFTDFCEMLEDDAINVVHICTPHYLHAPMAIKAMERGKHVLTEKPMAISVRDAGEMIRVSRKTDKTLGVCFQNRYNATSMKIREVLRSGKAGKILGAKAIVTWSRSGEYYTESGWRGTWEKEGGGVLINQSIHTLDLVQWFMGEIDGIKAHVDTRLLKGIIEVEDTADATITFKSGSSCIFFATNNYAVNSPVEIEIICENAVLKLRDILDISYSDGSEEHISEAEKAAGQKAYWGDSHKYLIGDFYEGLLKGKKFALDGEEGIVAIKMIDAIYRSSKTNDYVQLQTI